jgi:ankyrin repeat protein
VLQRGGEVNSTDEDGWTPLMEAGLYDDVAMADLLLAHHADVKTRDIDGQTALVPSVPISDLTLHRKLLARGADPENRDVGRPAVKLCHYRQAHAYPVEPGGSCHDRLVMEVWQRAR